MSKKYITFGLDPEAYSQLETIAKSMNMSIHDAGRFASNFLVLWLKSTAIRAHFNNPTEFDKVAAETFKKFYNMTIEEAEAQETMEKEMEEKQQ